MYWKYLCLAASLAWGSLVVASAAPPVRQADLAYYQQEVRPVLARRCFECHGAEAKRPQGDLRLDTAAGVRTVVSAGDPDGSRLLRAVLYRGGAPAMPPSGKLPDVEIAVLREWVRRGTPLPPESVGTGAKAAPASSAVASGRSVRPPIHWAFRPLRKPAVPAAGPGSWGNTPVDRFVQARLAARGLRPSPPADRRTLIRRLTFDLTGLPPTPEEVREFLADARPSAYERLVDRLLASPRYGERWGRHWLDVVHYGDTHGYDKDKRRDHAWPYRDYVIRAFNQDKPYARFVKEQLAGDVLYPEDPEGIVATGFIAAGPWDFVGHVELAEGTVEKQKTRLLDRDDMVANAMSTFTSLTVHCARCHDHKFDPISQKEYYGLQAVFAGVERGERPYRDRETAAQQSRLESRREALRRERAELERKAAAVTSPDLQRLDGEIVTLRAQLAALPAPAEGPPSPSNGYHSAIEPRPDAVKWVQLDLGRVMPLERLRLIPARPTDFRDTPGFGFPVRFRVAVSETPSFDAATIVADETERDYPNPGTEPLVLDLGGRRARYVRITATRLWRRTDDYVFALAEVEAEAEGKNVAPGATVTAHDSIEQGRWSARNLVDGFDSRVRLPDRSDPAVRARLATRAGIESTLRAAEARRRDVASALVHPETRAGLERTAAALREVERQLATLPPPGKVYAALSRSPRPIHLLARGDVERPLEPVEAGALSCLSSLPGALRLEDSAPESARRAALARWIADPRNALTWRSIVNRVWHYHFGRGIVDTPNDFGRNGATPSHPELLDWLAAWFLEHGQSLKQLHRLLVTSAVYRQGSAERQPERVGGAARGGSRGPDPARVDAENRLLWRMNRQRLDAESIRDSVLAATGKLDLSMGGPGFELFRFKDDHSPIYDHAHPGKSDDPRTFRRTVYRFVVRSVPNPFLDSLDCADPNISTPVRNTTLTALQALALLNEPFMVRQAQYLAERLQRSATHEDAQLELAFQILFARAPRREERDALRAYVQKHGLANACRLLLNANEFVFID